MSAIDDMLANETPKEITDAQVKMAIRKLATNKDLRVFLTAINRYSKSDWEGIIKTCKLLYTVAQSSLLIRDDRNVMEELVKYPHIACFMERLAHE